MAETLRGQSFTVIRQAGETGQLYGRLHHCDIADLLQAGGFNVQRSLDRPIKGIGMQAEIAVSSSGGRGADHPECSPAPPTRPAGRRAART